MRWYKVDSITLVSIAQYLHLSISEGSLTLEIGVSINMGCFNMAAPSLPPCLSASGCWASSRNLWWTWWLNPSCSRRTSPRGQKLKVDRASQNKDNECMTDINSGCDRYVRNSGSFRRIWRIIHPVKHIKIDNDVKPIPTDESTQDQVWLATRLLCK